MDFRRGILLVIDVFGSNVVAELLRARAMPGEFEGARPRGPAEDPRAGYAGGQEDMIIEVAVLAHGPQPSQ